MDQAQLHGGESDPSHRDRASRRAARATCSAAFVKGRGDHDRGLDAAAMRPFGGIPRTLRKSFGIRLYWETTASGVCHDRQCTTPRRQCAFRRWARLASCRGPAGLPSGGQGSRGRLRIGRFLRFVPAAADIPPRSVIECGLRHAVAVCVATAERRPGGPVTDWGAARGVPAHSVGPAKFQAINPPVVPHEPQ